jgi:hypothetical protein
MSTETVAPEHETTSGAPSPFTSPTATSNGRVPALESPLHPATSPSRAISMYAMCALLLNVGGGAPHPVGFPPEHEQRPSPPIERAASIEAISFAARSPGVSMIA